MGRRDERLVISSNAGESGRDDGKTFLITEMSAFEGWEVSQELFRLMGQGGFTAIPDDVVRMGCAGLATLGMSVISAASMDSAKAMRDILMKSVQIVIENEGREIVRAVDGRNDFEEIETIRKVLDKVFEMNFGFLTLGGE